MYVSLIKLLFRHKGNKKNANIQICRKYSWNILIKYTLKRKSYAFTRERLRMSKKSCTFVGCIVCALRKKCKK